jgi:DNA-binding IclR family transcriptional regulator
MAVITDVIMDDARYSGTVKSAVRVIEILELFEARRTELSVQDIVTALKLPQSSVSALVKTLVAQGYLTADPEARRYRPSERLAFLGHWTLGASRGMAEIQALMGAVSDAISESVLLGCHNGLHMRYVHTIESQHTLRFTLRPNQLRPIHACGLGVMLLSRLPDAEVSAIVRRYRADHERDGTPSEAETLDNVRLARAQGYFETFGMVTQGVGTISTLLPLPVDGRALALGVGGPLARLDRQREMLRRVLLERSAAFAAGEANAGPGTGPGTGP